MSDYQAGDVGFSRGGGMIDRSIQFAQRIKYGNNSTAARWNHCLR